MPYETLATISFGNLLLLALSYQTFSLVLAALLTPAILIVARIRRGSEARHDPIGANAAVTSVYRPERVALGVAAGVVIVAFLFVYHVPGYLFDLVNIVEWWKYATPVAAAALGVLIGLGVIVFRGSLQPEEPMLSPARRTWAGFGPRLGLVGAGLATAALVGTTVAAGLASSADAAGRYIYLEVVAPNASIGPVLPWFYGWAFGAPVLICTAILIPLAWAALRMNAARPFRRNDTVGAERLERVRTATSITRIATAGMLLALGGAWRFIAAAGSISTVVQQGEDGSEQAYETTWRYAEFALAAGWLAPAVEVTALVLLLLVLGGMRRERPRPLADATDPVPETISAR